MLRVIAMLAGMASALPAMGGEMTASEARHFVAGKLFSYACFDGTRGLARVNPDGSVDGSIQPKGTGPTRYGTMPAATLRVEGERVCASLASSIIQPCFYLERTNAESFRGSVSGLSFAYCNFTRYEGRAHFVQTPRQQKLLSQTADK
jgi:hypothetical protein